MALHTDDPTSTVVMPDGRVIRNLTDDEYRATLADEDASPHPKIPDDVLAAALARCEG